MCIVWDFPVISRHGVKYWKRMKIINAGNDATKRLFARPT